jgi:hypothetical protein
VDSCSQTMAQEPTGCHYCCLLLPKHLLTCLVTIHLPTHQELCRARQNVAPLQRHNVHAEKIAQAQKSLKDTDSSVSRLLKRESTWLQDGSDSDISVPLLKHHSPYASIKLCSLAHSPSCEIPFTCANMLRIACDITDSCPHAKERFLGVRDFEVKCSGISQNFRSFPYPRMTQVVPYSARLRYDNRCIYIQVSAGPSGPHSVSSNLPDVSRKCGWIYIYI